MNACFSAEKVINNIDFTMTMENMPLTREDKSRLRNCLSGKYDINKILQETIKKHSLARA